MLDIRRSNISNYYYLVDNDQIVGVRTNPGEFQKDYMVGDTVDVTNDGHGYISPGISTPGRGKITAVHKDDTDHFFTVVMENGEVGLSVKPHRLKVVCH